MALMVERELLRHIPSTLIPTAYQFYKYNHNHHPTTPLNHLGLGIKCRYSGGGLVGGHPYSWR